MSTRLERKTALVTGATSNIGRAIATAFAAEGAHVIVSGRNPQRGAEVVEQIHAAGGHADFIATDLDGSAHASGGEDGADDRAEGVVLVAADVTAQIAEEVHGAALPRRAEHRCQRGFQARMGV